jgi:hypothetical protein
MTTNHEGRSRDDKLEQWLLRVQARHLWVVSVPGATLRAYLINARAALVLHHAAGHGWELFVPASSSVDIVRTLDDAALALGTEGCAGL